jgi:hypothetical protein
VHEPGFGISSASSGISHDSLFEESPQWAVSQQRAAAAWVDARTAHVAPHCQRLDELHHVLVMHLDIAGQG